jgi:hypothetical protein
LFIEEEDEVGVDNFEKPEKTEEILDVLRDLKNSFGNVVDRLDTVEKRQDRILVTSKKISTYIILLINDCMDSNYCGFFI